MADPAAAKKFFVDDELMAKIREAWLEFMAGRDHLDLVGVAMLLFGCLHEETTLHNFASTILGMECVVLYGQSQTPTLKESVVGTFHALESGLVVLIPAHGTDLCGIIKRVEFRGKVHFDLVSFLDPQVAPNLSLHPPVGESWRLAFLNCPYVIAEDEPGMGGSGSTIGITASRWEELGRWLERWLPQGE